MRYIGFVLLILFSLLSCSSSGDTSNKSWLDNATGPPAAHPANTANYHTPPPQPPAQLPPQTTPLPAASSAPPAAPQAYRSDGTYGALSPEDQIVFNDHNGRMHENETDVKRARFLIDYLADSTTSSRPEISKAAINASKIIEDKIGIKYTALEVLEGCRRIVDVIPPGKRGKKDEIMTLTYLIYLDAKAR